MQGRPVAQVEQLLEAVPGGCALILLDLDVPHLGALLQIEGGHPHLLLLHDPLLMEVRLTSVDEDEWIGFPIIAGKIHLLEPWASVAVVFAGGRPAGTGGGGHRELLPEPLDLGLQGLDRCG